MKGKILSLIFVAIIVIICAFIFWFLFGQLREPSNRLVVWEDTISVKQCIDALIPCALLSPDKKFVFIVTREKFPIVYSILPDFQTIKNEHFIGSPLDSYVWNVLWVGKWLVLQYVYGDPFIIEREINGIYSNFAKYVNAGIISVWSKDEGWKRIMERTSLYAGFIPGTDGNSVAIVSEREDGLWEGFLYSLPEGKRIRKVAWRGAVFRGPYYSYPNHPFLVWDTTTKQAWTLGTIKGMHGPVLSSVNFDGEEKFIGKIGEAVFVREYSQPSPGIIAVLIAKGYKGLNPDPEKIFLAHYSSSKKIWETRIPWEEIQAKFGYLVEIVAITPDGKGIVFQDGIGTEPSKASTVRVWVWREGRYKFITKMPPIRRNNASVHERTVGWLDDNNLLVISGTKEKMFLGVVKLP